MSAEKPKGIIEKFYANVMPAVYGLGAAVVIVGAMFKLLNLSGASTMLAVGLTTEAALFILGIFEPKEKPPYEWSRVFPELGESAGSVSGGKISRNFSGEENEQISKKLDELFAKGGLDLAMIERLRNSIESFSNSSAGIESFSSLREINEKYVSSVSKISDSIENIGSFTEKTSSVMEKISSLGNLSNDFSSIANTLNSLNSLYRQELEHVEKRLSAISNTSNAYKDISSSIAESDMNMLSLKDDILALKDKLHQLNSVYEKMLNAIKS